MKLNHWKSLIVAILLATGCNRESLIDAIKIPKPKKSDYPSPSTIEYFILGDNVPFLDRSESCAFDDAGNYYHAMFDQKYIVKRNSQLEYVSHFGGLGSGAGQFTTMGDIVIRDDLNEVYVVDSGGNRINVFNKNGTFLRAIGTVGLGLGEFTSPRRMIFGDNKFFVSDNSARIQVFDASFTPLFEYSVNGTSDGEFKNITGLGMDGSNRLWVSDSTRLNIQIFTVDTVGQSLIFTDKITNVDFAGTLSTIQFDSVNDLMWICKTGNKCYSYKTSDFSLQDTVTASNTPVNTCILGRKLYYVSSKSFIGTIDMDTKIYSIAMQGGKGNPSGRNFCR
jgi:hypothetical protein